MSDGGVVVIAALVALTATVLIDIGGDSADTDVVLADTHSLGPAEAAVTVVAFGDFL